MDESKIVTAMKMLRERYPYLAPFIYRMKLIERPSVGTLSADRWGRVYYNEGYLVGKNVEELAGDLMQIVERLMRGHGARRGGREPFIWFLATLLESGDDVQEMGFPRSSESLAPDFYEMPKGLSAEAYYHLLMEMDFIDVPFTMRGPDGRPLSKDGRIRFRNPERPEAEEEDRQEMPIFPDGEMTGEQMPWEDGEPTERGEMAMDPLLMGGIRDEVAEEAAEWAEITNGKVPDWLVRQAGIYRSRDSWKRRLERLIGDSMRWGSNSTTFTWGKPSLMEDCIPDGLTLPTYEVVSPAIAAVVDTSDSMQQDELARALGQIDGVLRAMGLSEGLIVLPTDSTAKEAQTVFSVRQLQLIGGGGTDMGAGLIAAKNLRPRPEATIVITDGYTGWPTRPPGNMQVIVVNVSKRWPTDDNAQKNYPMPKWAKLVMMFPPKGRRRKSA